MKRELLILCVLFAISPSASAQPDQRKRVAVFPFEFGSVQKWWEDATWDIGKGVADLVVDELLKDKTLRVVERTKLDAVIAEKNLVTDQRTNAKAAEVGKLLGVNVMLTGSITQFGLETKKRGFGGIGIPLPLPRVLGGVGISKQKGKAKVAVTARIVDAGSAEILSSVTGTGESQREGLLLGGIAGGSKGIGGAGISLTSEDFRQTVLGEATYAAVVDLVKQLVAQSAKIPDRRLLVRGLVADVEGHRVILNVGANQGVSVGDNLEVFAVTKAVKDPATGEVIHEETQDLGVVRIDSVAERSSVGTILTGNGVQVGHGVRTAKGPATQ